MSQIMHFDSNKKRESKTITNYRNVADHIFIYHISYERLSQHQQKSYLYTLFYRVLNIRQSTYVAHYHLHYLFAIYDPPCQTGHWYNIWIVGPIKLVKAHD
jgi:hypothetical protein